MTRLKCRKIVFADLKVGDLVVHRNHGIAVFTGVKTIENDGVTKDYICLKYRDDDVLYVPTENLDNVRKYIGQEGGVKLNKLGTKEWQETKAKIKGNLRAVAKDLIELYAKESVQKVMRIQKIHLGKNNLKQVFHIRKLMTKLDV